jgi:glycosyltransferase involved in cell wall biosynthesis
MLVGAFTCVKNEQRIILEWIAHYISIGVQRIHVFDNGSSDGTVEKLELASKIFPIVTWERWKNSRNWHIKAFTKGIRVMQSLDVDWAIACDADEFLCCESYNNIYSLLAYFDNSHAIGVNWAIFGSNGLTADPQKPYLECFVRRAPYDFRAHHNIKSIVRPSMVSSTINSHTFALSSGVYKNSYKEELRWLGTPGVAQQISLTWRFQHYFCRNLYALSEKVQRAREAGIFHLRTDEDWEDHDRNEIFDDTGIEYLRQSEPIRQQLLESS